MKRWRQLGAKVGIKEWDVRRPLEGMTEVDVTEDANGEELEATADSKELDVAGEKTASVQVAEVKESQEPNEKVPVTTSVSEVQVTVAC